MSFSDDCLIFRLLLPTAAEPLLATLSAAAAAASSAPAPAGDDGDDGDGDGDASAGAPSAEHASRRHHGAR